jgi:probable HAF family extracellular repeat protein
MPSKTLFLGLTAFCSLSFTATNAAPPQYEVTFLADYGAGGSFSLGINASGQVTGSLGLSSYDAVVWSSGSTEYLAGLGGSLSRGQAINNLGQVVGIANRLNDPSFRPVIWNGSTPTELGTLGGNNSSANDINSSGVVVGNSEATGNAIIQAVRWDGITPTILGGLGGTGSVAEGINDSGEIAGYSWLTGNTSIHAVRWIGTMPVDLGTLGGNESSGLAINSSGTIVGYSTLANGTSRAVLWNGTTPTVLGTLGGNNSIAYGINSAGDVIGHSETAAGNLSDTAFIYTGGIMYNLLDLIEPGTGITNLQMGGGPASNCINDSGQIAAFARTSSSRYVVLLTPTPEPTSALLALVGGAALAMRRQRSASR